MVGISIKESKRINDFFDCTYFNLMASNSINESGKITIKKIAGFLKIWVRLFAYLLAHKPTLCYMALTTTGAAFKRDVLIVALLKMFKVKRVYHLHNKGVSRFDASKLYSFLYRYIFKNATTILLSERLYSDISKYADIKNIRVCPNGITENNVIQKEIDKVVPNILFLSNLIDSKGVKVLVDACRLLSERKVEFSCSFVGGIGDISKEAFNRYVSEQNLVEYIKFLGKKVGSEKNEIYKKADIFAFPTFYSNECFPLVILEAMQAKLPVVSTFEGGIPDIIDEGVTGFIVRQKDVEALADRLEILIKDKTLRQKMGNAGYDKYLKEFTFERFEQRMTDILSELTAKS